MPAEWEKHQSVWLAWPSAADLWEEDLFQAQAEFTALAENIADGGRGERLNVLVPDEKSGIAAETALRGLPVQLHLIPFGDIWLRDTAPLFLKNQKNESATIRFQFNGWGGKYVLNHDALVSQKIAQVAGLREFVAPWILEGGSVELDGEGTCLTSRQCLLNVNRNPQMDQAAVERALSENLGVQKTLWVGDGLINDHTDGHIDTIARYIAPGTVMCMKAMRSDDPNAEILTTIQSDLESMTDAKGRKLKVVAVPSPHSVRDEDGRLMPASYVNFYISNTKVIVPIYGSEWDNEAVAAIAEHFPDRKTIGLSARAILSGGGAFHCISQQQPV